MTAGAWQFGDIEFDEADGRLTVDGRDAELDRNCRAILSVLLNRAGAEVSKEDLLDAGWPNRIVHENSLAKAIGRLRQILGEQGEALETVYGHGYKLNVQARQTAAAPAVESSGSPISHSRRGLRRPLVLLAAVVVLFAAAGIGAAFWLDRSRDGEPAFRSTPPIIGDAPDAIGRLLWVDDHPQNNIYEQRFFEDHRIAVHTVTNSADALKLLAMYDYTAVISDMGRGEDRLAGARLAEQMRARSDETPVVIYTIRADGAAEQQAQRNLVAEAGAHGLAVTPQEVRSVVLRLFGNPRERETS